MSSPWAALRLVATLTVAGVAAGTVLAGVHLLTQPAIERHRAEALERAVYQVLPGSTSIQAWHLDADGLHAVDAVSETDASAGRPVWQGLDADGTSRGFAVVAEGPGFQDTIRLLYGLDPQRRVITGVAILESRETPGLGDKILHDEAFHRSLSALAVEPSIEVVMGTPTAPNQIDGITGATISSQAVASILDASAREVLDQLVTALENADAGVASLHGESPKRSRRSATPPHSGRLPRGGEGTGMMPVGTHDRNSASPSQGSST